MQHSRRILFSLVVGLLSGGAGSRVAMATEIEVTGAHQVSVAPNLIRMHCRLMVEADAAATAGKKLDDSITALRAQLDALGGAEFAFSPMEQLSLEADRADHAAIAAPIRLGCVLTVEWAMRSSESAAMLGEFDAARDQIKTLALPPVDRGGVATDRADVSLESAPVWMFVRQLTDAEVDAAMASAFEAARDKAVRIARASGDKLGRLTYLSDAPAGLDLARLEDLLESGPSASGAAQRFADVLIGDEADRPAVELSAPRLTMLRWRATAHARFGVR
jgi:hypothetical protein